MNEETRQRSREKPEFARLWGMARYTLLYWRFSGGAGRTRLL